MDTLATVNAKTIAAYDLAAEKYHELFHDGMSGKAYDRELLDRFARGLGHGALVCDAGCGPSAQIGRYLCDRGLRVVGVDLSPRCVELARRHQPDMEFEAGDMGELHFDDDVLDGIVAYYSIISTPKRHLSRIFREFHRVLKPGGAPLVVVKAGDTEGYVEDLLGYPAEIYFALFDENEIADSYTDTGFELVFLERRDPYEFEIANERIFALGRKT